MAPVSGYDGFISYSHQHDAVLGPVLKTSLERFAKPWYKMRELRIFLDTADLGANPGLWPSIVDALGSSTWFILLASPDAAESRWVNREIQWWVENAPLERLLVVATSPGLAWDDRAQDWAASAPVPAALRGAFRDEPHWVDLSAVPAGRGRPKIPASIAAAIAAPLRGKHLDELVGEHLRQHRRAMRLAEGVAAVLAVLTALAVVVSILAVRERDTAIAERNQALSSAAAAQAPGIEADEPGLARQLMVEAYKLAPTQGAESDLLTGLSVPGLLSQLTTVNAVTYDPGQPVLAVATGADVELDDPVTGAVVGSIPDVGSTAVAFSPDGRLLAASGPNGTIEVWDVSRSSHPALISRLASQGSRFGSVAFSRDGSMIGALDESSAAWVWSVASPRHPAVVGRFSHVGAFAFGSGSLFAAGDNYNQAGGAAVGLWKLTATAAPVAVTTFRVAEPAAYGGITALAFSPDASALAVGTIYGNAVAPTGGGAVIAVIAGLPHPRLAALPVTQSPAQLAYNPQGTVLAVRATSAGAGNGDISLFNVAGGKPVAGTVIAGVSGTAGGMAFSSDGTTLCAGGADAVLLWRVTDPLSSSDLVTLPADTTSQLDNSVDAIAFSPARHLLATGSRDGLAHLWNVADPARPALLSSIQEPGSSPVIYSVAFSPAGDYLATGGDSARLWDITNPARPSLAWADTSTGGVASLGFSSDGHTLAGGDFYQDAFVWPAGNQGNGTTISPPGKDKFGNVISLFSPSGRTLWILDGQSLRAFAVQAHGRVSLISGATVTLGGNDVVTSAAFSPDGHTLAVTGLGIGAEIWHLATASSRPALVGSLPVKSGGAVSFSPDGKVLAFEGATLGLWNVTDPAQPVLITSLPAKLGELDAVAFSPDGRIIANASSGGTVELWDVSYADLAQQLCRDAGTPITAAQWRTYLGSIPYSPPCQ